MHAERAEHTSKRERKGCCDDETEYLRSDEDQITHSVEWQLKKPIPTQLVGGWLSPNEWHTSDRQTLHYLNYKPPLIVYNLPVRLQTFLF